MKNLDQLIHCGNLRFINNEKDDTIFQEPNHALVSFAIDDAIATTVGNMLAPPTVRIWVHHNTLVLGIPDSRLPYLEHGIQYIKDLNYHVIIRNSGGLAVLLDKGVLNMSLILPSKNQLSIHDGYELMYSFIKHLFQDDTSDILAYEIKGSYCPGDFDLSIDGIKFAGISQRRVRNGVAVQIYIDIEGSSKKRATIVKEFYERSIQSKETRYKYPNINPNVMGSINELLNKQFSVNEIINKIELTLGNDGKNELSSNFLHEEETIFRSRLEQMNIRNKKLSNFI